MALDNNFVYYGADVAADANAPVTLQTQATAKFKSDLLDKSGLSVQAFEHSRATLAGVNGKAFAIARDKIFQSMMDEISKTGIEYMNGLIARATQDKLIAGIAAGPFQEEMKAVAVESKKIPQSLARAFAENYVRAVSQQLMDDLELLFPSEYVNYSILNVKRGNEAEKPVVPRP